MRLIDVHNHSAWNIDDGMPNREDAIQTLVNAKNDGIEKIVATPHFVPGVHTNDADINILNERIDDLKELAKSYGIEIFHGSEVFLNHEYLDMIERHQFNTMGDSSYVLVEFDVRKDILSIEDADDRLYELTVRNYRPLIAHVERYFHKGIDLDRVRAWIDMGCYIQVNRTSLLGMHGKVNEQNADLLLGSGLVHIVASDTHRVNGPRSCKLSDAYKKIETDYGQKYADMLLYKNPNHILSDEILETMNVHKKSLFQRILKRGK